jgi:hypothetical protein
MPWRCSVLLFGERGGSPCEQGYEEQAQSYQIMEGAAEQAAQGENKASFDADLGAGIQGPRAGFKITSAMALLTDSAIETFLDEVRPVGKANGLLKEEHVEIIRTALLNRYDAAGDDPPPP